jgi:hypothetical protein
MTLNLGYARFSRFTLGFIVGRLQDKSLQPEMPFNLLVVLITQFQLLHPLICSRINAGKCATSDNA